MVVTMRPVIQRTAQRVRVLNSYLGIMYETTDIVERPKLAATVDGAPWTVAQTEQALRDSSLCRCGGCACCLIRQAERKARS